MPKRVPQVLVSILFVGLLLVPLALKKFGKHDAAPGASGAKEARSRHGFQLQEVAQAAGVQFVHQAPTLDPKLEPIMPQVASMGAGVSICDYDRDGWQDFYLTQSGEKSRNRLYRNRLRSRRWFSNGTTAYGRWRLSGFWVRRLFSI